MRQKYGQHFLTDKNRIAQIVDAAFLLRADEVVEIGPGKGALTQELVSRGLTRFTAVEIDPEMTAYLSTHLPPQAKVRVLQENFLNLDLTVLPAKPTTFISNLPYLDAAQILNKVLAWPYFQTAVFMFQKEHAQKILARPGTDFYGPMSIFSQLRARIHLLCRVGRTCFTPPPKVESAVLIFERISPPDVAWVPLHRLVSRAFLHRRKTLLNALALGGYDKTAAAKALAALHLMPDIRPEDVSPAQYVQLVRLLSAT